MQFPKTVFLDSFDFLVTHHETSVFTVFPEGTRISTKTQKSSKEFMKKQGYPELRHLICPRFKGTQDILREVGLQMLPLIVAELVACSTIGISIRTALLPDVGELCTPVRYRACRGVTRLRQFTTSQLATNPLRSISFGGAPAPRASSPKRTISHAVRHADSRCAGVVSLRLVGLFRRLPAEVHVHIDRLPIDSVPV